MANSGGVVCLCVCMCVERGGGGGLSVALHQYISESADAAQSPAWICMQVGSLERELA